MIFFTIGVYNSTEQEFFDKLIKNKVDTFCDIRRRRGVRGLKYSFVNSQELQRKLQVLNIRYEHFLPLAPTEEIRQIQKKEDKAKRQLKNERDNLAEPFVHAYSDTVLNPFDFPAFLTQLKSSGAHNVALFCVEEMASACHRSLVAKKLRDDYNYPVKDI